MSQSHHFIIQATAEQLARHWPDNARYMNRHTDPWHFIYLRFTNLKEDDCWRRVCDTLGYDFDNEEYFAFNNSRENSADLGEYSIFHVGEDEADDWIREAESFAREMDME